MKNTAQKHSARCFLPFCGAKMEKVLQIADILL